MRILAGVAAAILALLVGRYFAFGRGPVRALTLLQVGVIPAAGFAYYAVWPSTVSAAEASALAPAIVATCLVAGALIGWSWTRGWAEPVSFPSLRRRAWLAIAIRASVLTALCIPLVLLAPAFALLAVTANLAWALAWLPRRSREITIDESIVVAAPGTASWAMLTDPINRRRYDRRVKEVATFPEGRLQLGTEMTTIAEVPLLSPYRGNRSMTMKMRSRVTAMAPESSFTMTALDRVAISTTELTSEGGGTRVMTRLTYATSIPDAIMGGALQNAAAVSGARAAARERLEGLKQVLENPKG